MENPENLSPKSNYKKKKPKPGSIALLHSSKLDEKRELVTQNRAVKPHHNNHLYTRERKNYTSSIPNIEVPKPSIHNSAEDTSGQFYKSLTGKVLSCFIPQTRQTKHDDFQWANAAALSLHNTNQKNHQHFWRFQLWWIRWWVWALSYLQKELCPRSVY